VREICNRAGVSTGLLRHYFDGKDALIIEAYRTLTREYHGSLRGVLSGPAQSAEQKLRSFFDAYFSSRVTGHTGGLHDRRRQDRLLSSRELKA
jgi:AcrR family transcriptional regulator